MYEVKVLEDKEVHWRPYRVAVNGEALINRRGAYRRFSTSKAAAIAGAKAVDRRKAVTAILTKR